MTRIYINSNSFLILVEPSLILSHKNHLDQNIPCYLDLRNITLLPKPLNCSYQRLNRACHWFLFQLTEASAERSIKMTLLWFVWWI